MNQPVREVRVVEVASVDGVHAGPDCPAARRTRHTDCAAGARRLSPQAASRRSPCDDRFSLPRVGTCDVDIVIAFLLALVNPDAGEASRATDPPYPRLNPSRGILGG